MTAKTLTPLLALLLGLQTVPAAADKCDTDAVPAATLLVPYFEVDLAAADGRTTLVSVRNQDSAPVLVKAVVWTDWAIPSLGFEIYLSGYDTQSLNLRDLFVYGRLPRTGSAVSPHGELSAPPVDYPGCNATTTPGAAPVYPNPALSAADIQRLQDFHTGRCSADGQRAGFPYFEEVNNIARGYLTFDVVRRCSDLTPADSGYFGNDAGAVADDRNVLTGDYFLVDTAESFAQGETAVHVESFPGGFEPGDYTFYKRYVGGTAVDHREPLGTIYSFRHLVGGAFDGGTSVIVWRDTGSPDVELIQCTPVRTYPAWYGLGGLESYRVFTDEDGASQKDRDICPFPFPCGPFATAFATQMVEYNTTNPVFYPDSDFGWTYLVLRNTRGLVEDWPILQGWVSVMHSASGRYSVGQRAQRLDSACAPGPVAPRPAQ